VGALAKSTAHVEPVHVGQSQVEQEDVGVHCGEGLGAGPRARNLKPFLREAFGQRDGDPVLVFDD
jgi:hypothetical protein